MPDDEAGSLICRAGALLCALPTEGIALTTRLLPVEPLPGTPEFVAGSTVVRGAPVPVVMLSHLLGTDAGSPERLVMVRAGQRMVALAVDEVVGFRSMSGGALAGLPPLLSGVARAAVRQLGVLDGDLLALLDAASLIPDAALAAIDKTSVPA